MLMEENIVNDSITVGEALARLNDLSGKVMTLLVVDDRGVMTGTVTDGDIRRGLLRGVTVNDPVSEVLHRNFRAVNHGEDAVKFIRSCRRDGVTLLPVLNSDGSIHHVLNLRKRRSALPLSAILMAGGRGERLRPLTDKTPKPLLHVDGKPIIDYNIEALADVGIDDITVTTRYLAEMIDEHFSKPVAGVNVKTVREEMPLGTIGAVSLVALPATGNTLVMNSDLLTTVSYEEMYLHHVESHADVTVAVIPYVVSVPYAILATEGEEVTAIEEKPTYTYFANAGIYIFSNRLLATLKRDVRTDATDLVQQAIDGGDKVTYFPINGTWIDVGSPADFRHAEELMRYHRNLTE